MSGAAESAGGSNEDSDDDVEWDIDDDDKKNAQKISAPINNLVCTPTPTCNIIKTHPHHQT